MQALLQMAQRRLKEDTDDRDQIIDSRLDKLLKNRMLAPTTQPTDGSPAQ
jgi:hypothetical protein